VNGPVGAELLKLRTTRMPALLLLAGPLLVILGGSGLLARRDVDDPDTIATAAAHVGLTSLVALVLGITAVAGEHRHRTVADTYLTTPARTPVLLAKCGAYAAYALVMAVLSAAAALGTIVFWQALRGTVDLSGGALWLTLLGGLLWNVAFAITGVAIGATVRNLAGAVAGALAWLALVEGVLGQLLGAGLARWLPFAAGQAAARIPADGLPQAGAVALLVGYAAAALLIAQRTLDRDIT
jgi:ABC-2 type transport system permease protein